MAAPKQKRGRSFQDYGTPADFMEAVRRLYGRPAWDLAASETNRKAQNWIGVERDSLTQDWHKLGGLLWLNPPFGSIEPWARKCLEESRKGAHILLLTPASVGSNWYRDHVHRKARVLFLNGRITFDNMPPNPKTGKVDPYPKDCMLSEFGNGYSEPDVWDWRKTLALEVAA